MQIKKNKVVVLAAAILAAFICFFSVNCNNGQRRFDEGKALSKQYCQTCHKYPDPSLLDTATWMNQTLPAMAPHLGIHVNNNSVFYDNSITHITISDDDWAKIVDYYKAAAPAKLKPAKAPAQPVKSWAIFKLRKPLDSIATSATTMVAFDSISRHIYTSDMLSRNIVQWNDKLKQQKIIQSNSTAVDAQFSKDAGGAEHNVFTFIGTIKPVDATSGFVKDVDVSAPANSFTRQNNIADNLPRPVQSLAADFDKDGLTDWLVCGFGHNKGGLYWFKQLPDKQHYQRKEISALPGAEHAVIGDFNHDGWPDIMCLFAQAQEGIWLFLNDHKGGFTASNVLYFPPVYGSSSFQLVDFNHDGKPDILYTAGDNGDYSIVLKPYHGVYIFLNQGDFKFKQAYFYPVNGATKAVAADFNGDGKPDIAVIAFFADLKHNPQEGFTYFEQGDNLKFTPYRLPIADLGRWICMDVCDYNGDGKPDIILGNFSFGFSMQPDFNRSFSSHNPFIVLENNRKN